MMQKKFNKYSGTKQETSARQSRSVSRHQHRHSQGNSTRRSYAHSRSESIPSMSLVRHQWRRYGSDTLQGGLINIYPPAFNGENRKVEDVKAWLLGMMKYF
jgi:hypothetical protein